MASLGVVKKLGITGGGGSESVFVFKNPEKNFSGGMPGTDYRNPVEIRAETLSAGSCVF